MMTNQELEYRALKILERQPDLTQRQLAKELGISLGKTHYLIKSLIDVGWVKLDNFQKSDNKWGYAYLLTPMGISEKAAITARFLVRKKLEYNALHDEIEQLQEEVRKQKSFSDQWKNIIYIKLRRLFWILRLKSDKCFFHKFNARF